MIETSAIYKEQVVQSQVDWKVSARIDYSDYNIDNSIVTYQNQPERASIIEQISNGILTPSFRYLGWGNWQWGNHLRSSTSDNFEQGGLSRKPSLADGTFQKTAGKPFGGEFGEEFRGDVDYPKFSVTFLPRFVSQIRAYFDDKLQEWAVDFDVLVFDADGLQSTTSITGNTSVQFEQELLVPVLNATEVQVIVKKWSIPFEKAKLIESFTSVFEEYDSSQIESVEILEEVIGDRSLSPIGNLTANQCNMTLLNLNRKFDNDNLDSVLAGRVIKNRRVQPFFQLNDLVNDIVPGGIFYTNEWRVRNESLTAELSAQDIISLMGQSEYRNSQFINPSTDQQFTFTTTADFNTFSFDNVIVGTDEILFAGESIFCDDSIVPQSLYGEEYGQEFQGAKYCGTAQRSVTFTYTPGTTVTMNVSFDSFLPAGSNIFLYASLDAGATFQRLENGKLVFTPDDITMSSQIIRIMVFFESHDLTTVPILQELRLNFVETVTLFSIAALIIEDYDSTSNLIQGNYTIDPLFGEIEIANAFITPRTHREALKLICEAGAGNGYSARDGSINLDVIQPVSTPTKIYTDNDYNDRQDIIADQELFNRVTVLVNPLDQVTSPEELSRSQFDILDTETKLITLRYSTIPADDITVSYDPSLPGGVTLDSSVFYTWGADLTFTNTSGSDQQFTIVLNGRPYRVIGQQSVSVDNTINIRRNGVIELVIDNPLIQSEEQADFIARTIIDAFGEQRRGNSFMAKPDPSVVIGDSIQVDERFFIANSNRLLYTVGEVSQNIGGRA